MFIRYAIVYCIGLIAAVYMTWGMNNKSVELWMVRLLIAGFILFIISLMQPRKKKS